MVVVSISNNKPAGAWRCHADGKKSYKSYEMLTDIVFNKHEVFGNCIVRLDLFSMFLHENGIK